MFNFDVQVQNLAAHVSMDLPIKFTPLCPLFNTHVQIFLRTLTACKQLFGTENVFLLPSGSPISCVEIVGIVTEKTSKEGFIKLTLQDGTGRVQCLIFSQKSCSHVTVQQSALELQARVLKEEKLSNAQKRFHQSLIDGNIVPDVILGDILLIRGELRPLKWETGIAVTCKIFLKLSARRDCLDMWHSWMDRAKHLHENVYNQPFSATLLSNAVRKSNQIKEIGEILVEKLKNCLNTEVLIKDAKIFQFYGYEALEFKEISVIFNELFQGKSETKDEMNLARSEIASIRNNSLSAALHYFVQGGMIFKQKGFFASRITGIDQLDALYHVTNNCPQLRQIVNTALRKNDGTVDEKTGETIKIALLGTKLHFLARSKHFYSVINQVSLSTTSN